MCGGTNNVARRAENWLVERHANNMTKHYPIKSEKREAKKRNRRKMHVSGRSVKNSLRIMFEKAKKK